MKRVEFANTNKKMRKGYWIQQTPSTTTCSECRPRHRGGFLTIDSFASVSCKACHGTGMVSKPEHRYSVESGADPKVTVWTGNCGSCGNATRKFVRTGKCDCETAQCPHCHGKRCGRCNFKGRL